MSEPPHAKWTIERVELVLFNLEHKRWQIWWEHSTANLDVKDDDPFRSGALYRRQIIRFLDNVRQLMAAIAHGPFAISRRPNDELLSGGAIAFGGDQPDKAFWPLFLEYCRDTCEQYGIHSTKVHNFLRSVDLKSGDFSSPPALTRDDAADIVAAIPILANWDLFGCWYRCWKDTNLPQTFPPPAANARSWNEPFYMARIYKEPSPSQGHGVVYTEAICGNLPPGTQPKPVPCEPHPFFSDHYCHLPSVHTLSRHTYDAYAFLYDNLHKAMGFESTYIISYPILVYDRIHFLQVQVSGAKGPSAGLVDLWNDWLGEMHDLLWTTSLKTFFQEALQQLLIAYFESRWTETLRSHLKTRPLGELAQLKAKAKYEDLLLDSFGATGNLLVPLKSLQRARKRYFYRPYTWKEYLESRPDLQRHIPKSTIQLIDDCQPVSIRDELGAKWDEGPAGHEAEVQGFTIVPAIEDAHSTVGQIIARSRVGQLLDQQVSRMRIQFEPLRTTVESDRYQCLAEVCQHFADAARRDVYSSSFNPEQMTERAQSDKLKGAENSSVWSHLQLVYGGDEAESMAKLRGLCRPRLPEIVSECFSVGGLKGATHLEQWRGTKQELLADLGEKAALFEGLLKKHEKLKDWLTACQALVNAIIVEVAGNAVALDFALDSKHELVRRYKMLRWPESDSDFYSCNATTGIAGKVGWVPHFSVPPDVLSKKGAMKAYFPIQKILGLHDLLPKMKGYARDHKVTVARWRCADSDQEYRREVIGFNTAFTKLWSNVIAFEYEQERDEEGASLVASGLMKDWAHFTEDYGRIFVRKGDEALECVFPEPYPVKGDGLRRVIRPPEGEKGREFLARLLKTSGLQIFLVWQVWEEEPPKCAV